MSIHFMDIDFGQAKINFLDTHINIYIKTSFFRTVKHENLLWKDIKEMEIESLEDSAISLIVKFDKKEVILTTKEEVNLPKRKKTESQVELLKIYYDSKKAK